MTISLENLMTSWRICSRNEVR